MLLMLFHKCQSTSVLVFDPQTMTSPVLALPLSPSSLSLSLCEREGGGGGRESMRQRGGAEMEGYKPSQDKVEKKTCMF